MRAPSLAGWRDFATRKGRNPGFSLQVCDQSKKVSIYVHLRRHPSGLLLTLSFHDSANDADPGQAPLSSPPLGPRLSS